MSQDFFSKGPGSSPPSCERLLLLYRADGISDVSFGRTLCLFVQESRSSRCPPAVWVRVSRLKRDCDEVRVMFLGRFDVPSFWLSTGVGSTLAHWEPFVVPQLLVDCWISARPRVLIWRSQCTQYPSALQVLESPLTSPYLCGQSPSLLLSYTHTRWPPYVVLIPV